MSEFHEDIVLIEPTPRKRPRAVQFTFSLRELFLLTVLVALILQSVLWLPTGSGVAIILVVVAAPLFGRSRSSRWNAAFGILVALFLGLLYVYVCTSEDLQFMLPMETLTVAFVGAVLGSAVEGTSQGMWSVQFHCPSRFGLILAGILIVLMLPIFPEHPVLQRSHNSWWRTRYFMCVYPARPFPPT